MQRPDTRTRFRQSTATAAAAGALLCAFTGCWIEPGEPDAPGEPRQVRTSFAFQVAPGDAEYGMFLSLDEHADARGQLTGTITVNGTGLYGSRVVLVTPTTATIERDGELHVSPGGLSTSNDLALTWDALELRLQDQDGDSVLDSGTGHIAGSAFREFQDDFTAAPDGYPVTAQAYRGWSASPEMLPWESLVVALGQPVSSDQIPRYRVLADGQEVPGRIALEETDGLHTELVFVPDDFLPLGATIEVELDGVTNAIGVPVVLEQPALQVMADPGPILTNLGFEQTLAGWYPVGDAVVVARAGDLAPVEGAAMAALRVAQTSEQHRESRLVGHFDVPMDATVLDLSLALLAPEEGLPALITARLHRYLADGSHEVIDAYEFDHESAVFEPCACDELGSSPPLTRRAGPFRHEIDLSALRGERVFLEIQLHGEPWTGPGLLALAPLPPPPPPVPSILLVDDLQIR